MFKLIPKFTEIFPKTNEIFMMSLLNLLKKLDMSGLRSPPTIDLQPPL
jgi:hypothetical protein